MDTDWNRLTVSVRRTSRQSSMRRSAEEQEALVELTQHPTDKEHEQDRKVNGRIAESQRWDEPTQEPDRRIGGGVDQLKSHQSGSDWLPGSGEHLHPFSHHASQDEHEVGPEHELDDTSDNYHAHSLGGVDADISPAWVSSG